MELNVSDTQSQQQQQQPQQQPQQQQQTTNEQQQSNQQQQQQQQPPYKIPGILHYLQYEWHRFEVERQEWEVEKAELSARIALLQGEKKSHENLKHDLIRRIKMLEYCLRMERAKYHKLKHGTDPPPLESSGINQQAQSNDEDASQQKSQQQGDSFIGNNSNSSTVTYGRELLRHYLQEIGYTDTIIDLRSNRVRSLLGIVDSQPSNQQQTNSPVIPEETKQSPPKNNNISSSSSSSGSSGGSNNGNNSGINNNNVSGSGRYFLQCKVDVDYLDSSCKSSANDNNQVEEPYATVNKNPLYMWKDKEDMQLSHSEASALDRFKFLFDKKNSSQSDEEEDEEIPEDMVEAADMAASTSTSEYSYFDKDSKESTSVIRQKLDLHNNGKDPDGLSNTNILINQKDVNKSDDTDTLQSAVPSNANNWCPRPQKNDVVDIGELATLTTLGSESATDDYRRKQWTAKYRLQSHYDCVRALKFSETDPILVTASEDETIKLWHLSRQPSNSGKTKQPSLPATINAMSQLEGYTVDIEPLHTYRGHTSRILTLTICKNHIFSGAQNGELIMWRIISDPSSADLYEKFDSTLLVCKYEGHSDCVWSVETVDQPKSEPLLCSASADRTIKIWKTSGQMKEPIRVISLDYTPTCLAKMPLYNVYQAGGDIVVSSDDGRIVLYDIAACLNDTNTQPTVTFESEDSNRINSIVVHPSLPYIASADSNHDIKFWDLKTRKYLHQRLEINYSSSEIFIS